MTIIAAAMNDQVSVVAGDTMSCRGARRPRREVDRGPMSGRRAVATFRRRRSDGFWQCVQYNGQRIPQLWLNPGLCPSGVDEWFEIPERVDVAYLVATNRPTPGAYKAERSPTELGSLIVRVMEGPDVVPLYLYQSNSTVGQFLLRHGPYFWVEYDA